MKSTSSDRKRLVLVAVFLFGLNVLLILQFYKIQIIQQEKWTQGALAQHQKIVVETFRRGTIYSNTTVKEGHLQEEQPFVLDVLKFHLYIDPNSIPTSEKKAVCKKICQFLNKADEKPIYQEFLKKSRSRKIAVWLDKDQKNQILSWWRAYAKQKKIVSNAVYFVKEYQRSYPFGAMLGQVLQTVQDIKDPKTMQAYPIGGLELSLNNFLKGKIGKKILQRSARNPMDSGVVINQPEDGADVYLTINHYLQAIVEEELKKGVEVSAAKGGWAIIMDPFNGNILALAQYPFFDPRKYREYFNSEELKEHAKVKAVSDAFEPASIFKVITTAICMQANDELIQKNKAPLFTPEEKVPTSNGHFPGRKKPLRDGRLHKFLNLNMALQKSSNVYFGQLIKRVIDTFGENWYREKLLQFGFGQKTNVELPAETLGLVPTPGKKHQNGTLEWSKSTPYSLAMGHNILINSIQMVKAFSVIANGGFLVEPTLIRKIQKNNEVILDNTIEKKYPQILKKEHCDRIIHGMRFVTKLGGSSPGGNIPGYTEAGKSGTSEKIIDGKYSRNHFISSFIGLAPAKAPRLVLLVCLDEPEVKWVPGRGKNHNGGICSAPIFKDIAKRALEYLGVEPDDNQKVKEFAYETKELRQLHKKWNL